MEVFKISRSELNVLLSCQNTTSKTTDFGGNIPEPRALHLFHKVDCSNFVMMGMFRDSSKNTINYTSILINFEYY